MSGFRLPAGGAVDRGRPLAFTFDGKPFLGFQGDSIASALLANGVRVVGRSFKYHRPRGIWGAWTEDPNAIVDVTRSGRTTPNLRATVEPLDNDLAVRSVNALPTAAEDRAALLDRLSAFMPAGFYYKTFLWPRWETFEPAIRAMAGLGRVDPDNRPRGGFPQFNARCDTLVVAPDRPGSRRRTRRRARAAWCFSSTIAPTSGDSSFTAEARSRAQTGANGQAASTPRSKRAADG